MKPRLYYDNYRRAYYLQWDADSDHIGRQEPVFERTREYIESLEAENAKLRELVLYMWDFSCVVPDEPHTSKEELDYSVEVWKRMRELGVEVDE